MKKILSIPIMILFLLSACGGKEYNIEDKPIAIFKTNQGEFKIGFYKSAAPKSVQAFIKFCKEKKYKGLEIDLVSMTDYVIGIGYTKIFEDKVQDDLAKEIIPVDKTLSKNEVYFRTDDENIGKTFYIFNRPTALAEKEMPLVIFGKVVDSDKFLEKLMDDVRVDLYGKPVDKIEIVDVEIKE